MKNILFINHDNNEKGGASKSLLGLVKEMSSRGYNVRVVINAGNGKLKEHFEENGIKTFTLKFFWWQIPKKFSLIKKSIYILYRIYNTIALIQLKKIVINENIEIIHSNSSVIDIGMKLSEKVKLPHYWHFREFGDLDLNLQFIHNKDKAINKINKSNSKVIMISKSLSDYYGSISNKILCYNGVGDENIYYKTHHKDTFNITMTGRISRKKGQLEVIIVLNKILKEKLKNFSFYIYGFCLEEDYLEEITNYLDNHNMHKYVKIEGYKSNIHEIRRNMDIEIIASSSEAFGRVIIEAMKCSCLTITTDTGSGKELVNSGINGFIFSHNDFNTLYLILKDILLHSIDINAITSQAYHDVKDKFTIQTNCDDFIRIIENK